MLTAFKTVYLTFFLRKKDLSYKVCISGIVFKLFLTTDKILMQYKLLLNSSVFKRQLQTVNIMEFEFVLEF